MASSPNGRRAPNASPVLRVRRCSDIRIALLYPSESVSDGEPARELEEAASTGRVEHEGWLMRKNGERFWGHEIVTAIRDQHGDLLGFSKISRDLTEQTACRRGVACQRGTRPSDCRSGHRLRDLHHRCRWPDRGMVPRRTGSASAGMRTKRSAWHLRTPSPRKTGRPGCRKRELRGSAATRLSAGCPLAPTQGRVTRVHRRHHARAFRTRRRISGSAEDRPRRDRATAGGATPHRAGQS